MPDDEIKPVALAVRGAVIMRNSRGHIAPGSASPVPGGRPKGSVNQVRTWMKNEYSAYCEENGERANLLLFYEEVRTNEALPIQIRLEAARLLDRIVFPAHALAAPEKSVPTGEVAERGKKLAAVIEQLFTGDLPLLESPRDR